MTRISARPSVIAIMGTHEVPAAYVDLRSDEAAVVVRATPASRSS
jgi:hypothetical protein